MSAATLISNNDKADILAQALPYIRKFHGKTMVIKYGGNAMTDPALQKAFAEDVVLLKLVGINPVVVHGGGPQIENALKRLGMKGEFVQGMRVTDAPTMEVVEWVLGGEVQQDIVGLINQAGGKAVGLTGRDGGMIRAQKLKLMDNVDPSIEHDVGQVGDIVSVDPSVVKALQDDAFIPVISPIGFGENNESYNINADVVAAKLATVLVPWIIVNYVSTEFDQTKAFGDASLPDGTWGYYGKVVSDATYGTKYVSARPPATTCSCLTGTNDAIDPTNPIGLG